MIQVVTEVKTIRTGQIKGFRTWTLQAFDSHSNLILEISKDYGKAFKGFAVYEGHVRKMFDFMELLHQEKFMLTDGQIEELANLLSIKDRIPELIAKSRELNTSVTLYVECTE